MFEFFDDVDNLINTIVGSYVVITYLYIIYAFFNYSGIEIQKAILGMLISHTLYSVGMLFLINMWLTEFIIAIGAITYISGWVTYGCFLHILFK